MDRRGFIKTTTSVAGTYLTAALARPLLGMAKDSKYLANIGLQLWTVRDQLAADAKKTLKSVADAGYKQVELMDVGQVDELLPICKDLGLNVTSAFINWNTICNPKAKDTPTIDEIIAKAKGANLKHLVFGYIGKGNRETVAQYKQHIVTTNSAGAKCKEAGIQLGYHNHSFEFGKLDDGKSVGFDLFIQGFDPQLVKFELDVFWAKVGGWDPLATLRKLKGRVSQVHLKDLKAGTGTIFDEGKVPKDAFQECGNGTIDMAEVMKVAAEIGVEQCHVEQDQSPDPIASIGTSIQHLNGLSMASDSKSK